MDKTPEFNSPYKSLDVFSYHISASQTLTA